ncbi:hypothetical protein JCM8097_004813 [Rhodosporidiobolus ruineniae]
MSLVDKSDFERERDRLVADIADSLGKTITAVNQLNRNIENVTAAGSGVDAVHDLWSQFQDVMQSGSYADAEEQPNPILPRHDDTVRLPAGLAPGGGETALDLTASQAAAQQ